MEESNFFDNVDNNTISNRFKNIINNKKKIEKINQITNSTIFHIFVWAFQVFLLWLTINRIVPYFSTRFIDIKIQDVFLVFLSFNILLVRIKAKQSF